MKVAYEVSSMLGQRTGIGHYTATLLDHLLEVDPSLEIVPFAVTTRSDDSGFAARVKRLPLPGRLGVTLWTASGWPSGERLAGEADVFHGPNFWVPPLTKKNGIVTIHDLTFIRFPELCTPQIQRYRWIVPKVLRSCALVITPSEVVASQVAEDLSFPLDKITVTPEAVRGAFIDATPDHGLLERFGVRQPYVLFAGTQEPRKNLDRLIQSMSLVQDEDLTLVLAGPPGWGSVDLPALVKRLKLEARVFITGYLEEGELGALMAGASAFVFPTLYEGFGLPPLEAMAAGIPVVASRTGAHPEVLGDAPFYCDPLDVASIAGAISSAVKDDAARETAIAAGYQRVSQFSWTKTATMTLEAYRRVGA